MIKQFNANKITQFIQKTCLILIVFFLTICFISCYTKEKQEIENLKTQVEELTEKNIQLTNTSNELIKENDKYTKEEKVELLKEIEDLNKEIENNTKELLKLQNDLENVSKKSVALENQLLALQTKFDELTEQNVLLQTKYNNLAKYSSPNSLTLEIAKKAVNENKELLKEGYIIKVNYNDYYTNYVLFNDNLYEFTIDNENDDFDVQNDISEILVSSKNNTDVYCDRYFNLPRLNGIDKIKNSDNRVIYFYYYFGDTIEQEKEHIDGDYLFKNEEYTIYSGKISDTPFIPEIKNIIFMIPDGGGFGNLDYASLLKQRNSSGINGAHTQTTTNTIKNKNITGLYLEEYMIATSNTAMYNGEITDSGAGGTALSSGYKTDYCFVGLDHNYNPRANLIEVSQLEGKATGVVTSKSWIDATPSDFLSHSDYRTNQKDLSYQSLNSNVDVLLAYGTSNGSKQTNGDYLHSLDALDKGYVVVNNKEELFNQVYVNKSKRIWSNFLEGSDNAVKGSDVSGYHISYDCYSKQEEISLLEMSKAALDLLNNNINDKDGFCLMIEGGAIDNAAHGRLPLETVGEVLAYDETFAYMVNFAMNRRDTIVISVADHDTGGFIDQKNNTDKLMSSLINGSNLTGYTGDLSVGVSNDHTLQNVPVSFYAPEKVRNTFLSLLDLPLDASKDKIRTGKYYDGTIINEDYIIMNSQIAPAILKLCNMMSFDEASKLLFNNVNELGNYDVNTEIFTLNNGITIHRNENYYVLNNEKIPFVLGRGLYIMNTRENINTFYIPKSLYDTLF